MIYKRLYYRYVSLFRLRSRLYAPIGNECLRFWYFIKGPDGSTAQLSVVKQNDGSQATQSLWNKDVYGDSWRYGQVNVNGGFSNFHVVFTAITTAANTVVGIDDVIMTVGFCAPAINCDFERGDLCSWTQMRDDDFDWLLQQGETDSFGTGPTFGMILILLYLLLEHEFSNFLQI